MTNEDLKTIRARAEAAARWDEDSVDDVLLKDVPALCDALEAAHTQLRVIRQSCPDEHQASTPAGTAQNYIAHLEARVGVLEDGLEELLGQLNGHSERRLIERLLGDEK
jgi:hypothetical protein